MADTKPSNLTAVTLPLLATDELVLARAGTTRKVSYAALGGWVYVVKSADESVSASVTTQADDELFFTTVSGKSYEIEYCLIYASPVGGVTPDIKFDLGEDASSRGHSSAWGYTTADAASGGSLITNQTATVAFGTATTDRVIKGLAGYFGAGGVFRIRWAQNTSNANAVIVRAGSFIRYRQLN